MNENVCLCGHLKVHHCRDRKGGRGKCPCTTTFVFSEIPITFAVPSNTKILNPRAEVDVKTWTKILKGYSGTKKTRVRKRGYAYLDCSCPMFHLVDLGQIKLEIPK